MNEPIAKNKDLTIQELKKDRTHWHGKFKRVLADLKEMAKNNQELRREIDRLNEAIERQQVALNDWRDRAMSNLALVTQKEQQLEAVTKERDAAWLRLGKLYASTPVKEEPPVCAST